MVRDTFLALEEERIFRMMFVMGVLHALLSAWEEIWYVIAQIWFAAGGRLVPQTFLLTTLTGIPSAGFPVAILT